MALVEDLAQAIARFEGFFQQNSLAGRNNNPGNLRSWGNLPTSGGYAVFPTPEAGWAALRRQVELNIGRGLTLQEFFGGKPGVYPGYAPSADANDPANYAAVVAGWLSIDPAVPLTQYQAAQQGEPPGFTGPRSPGRETPGAKH